MRIITYQSAQEFNLVLGSVYFCFNCIHIAIAVPYRGPSSLFCLLLDDNPYIKLNFLISLYVKVFKDDFGIHYIRT